MSVNCSVRNRVLALLVGVAFLLESTSPFSDAQAAFTRTSPFDAASEGQQAFSVNAITLPLRLGEVKDAFEGNTGKTIIHIQDAHCNYSAQGSIAGIIEHLNKSYGIDLVALEGGAGEYDLSAFTRIEDRGLRREVADFFVREGEVSGAEFFAINNPRSVELYGIEDPARYVENLKAYRDSLAFKEDATKCLNALTHIVNNLKMKIYSPLLLAQDAKAIQFKANKINFKDYILSLSDTAKAHKVDLTKNASFANLLKVFEEERVIDFKEASRERNVLIDRLNKRLSKREIEELVLKSLAFKMGDISQEEYYGYLFKKAALCDVDFNSLPNLVKYSDYVRRYETMDKRLLMKDVFALEEKVFQALLKTEEQRHLRELDKNLAITRGMFETGLVKEDWDTYTKNRDGFKVENYLSFFEKKCPLYGLNFQIDRALTRLDSYRERMERFYTCSLKRDDSFLQNIAAKLTRDKKNIAILVTGGFHTGSLKAIFKEEGYSYVEIFPKIERQDAECPYFRLLAGGMDPVMKALLASQATIQIASHLNKLGEEAHGLQRTEIFKAAVKIVEEVYRDKARPHYVPMRDNAVMRVTVEPSGGLNILWVTGPIEPGASIITVGPGLVNARGEPLGTRASTSGGPGAVADQEAAVRFLTEEHERRLKEVDGNPAINPQPSIGSDAEYVRYLDRHIALQAVKDDLVPRAQREEEYRYLYDADYEQHCLHLRLTQYLSGKLGLSDRDARDFVRDHLQFRGTTDVIKVISGNLGVDAREIDWTFLPVKIEGNQFVVYLYNQPPRYTRGAQDEAGMNVVPRDVQDFAKSFVEYVRGVHGVRVSEPKVALGAFHNDRPTSLSLTLEASDEKQAADLITVLTELQKIRDRRGDAAHLGRPETVFAREQPAGDRDKRVALLMKVLGVGERQAVAASQYVPSYIEIDSLKDKGLGAIYPQIPSYGEGQDAQAIIRQYMQVIKILTERKPRQAEEIFFERKAFYLADWLNRVAEGYLNMGDVASARRYHEFATREGAAALAELDERYSSVSRLALVRAFQTAGEFFFLNGMPSDAADMYQKALQCIPEMREGEKRPDPSTFEGRTLDQLLGAREELTRRMEEARAMSGESRVATAGVVAMPVPLGDRQVTKFLAGAEEVPWREWLKGLEGLDREVVKGLMQNLFNGEPCMINIPIPNEEWTKQPIETYLGRMGMERTALDSLVIRYNMGNVTVRLYRDTEDGRAKLLKEVESEIQEKGIAKPERRIVSFAVKEAKSEKLEKLSYVVYLDRREGQTTLPVGHCGLLGLGILNYFNLEEKKASEEELRAAIDVIAKGISALTGEDDIKEIVKKVEEFVKRGDFAKSGFLMIEIRPIRTEEIKEFHEAEAQILRSL